MSRCCAPVLLSALVAGLLMLAPAARADTVSSSGGEVTYTQTSDAPQRLFVYLPADQLFVLFSPGDPINGGLSCGETSTTCVLDTRPSLVRVVLGDGDNVVQLNDTRLVPLEFDTGGGKDLVDLPHTDAASTVNAGAGDDVISARNAVSDTIDCGEGYDTVLVDPAPPATDVITDCERVLTALGSVDAPRSAELAGTFFKSWPITTSFTVSQDATDAQFECWVGASGFGPCANPYVTPDVPDGTHTVIVAARLMVGGERTDTLASEYTARIDRVAPPAATLDAPSGTITTASPSWKVTNEAELAAAGVFGVACLLDGDPGPGCVTSLLPAPLHLSDGPHTLTAQAADIDGNTSPISVYRFVVDATPPVMPTLRRVQIRGRTAMVSAGLGPGERLECSVGGAPFAACANPFTYTARRSGTVLLGFRAVDIAGNVGPPARLTAALRLARLTVSVAPRLSRARIGAICLVTNAVLKSCRAKLRVRGRTIAAASSRTRTLELLLTRFARAQLAGRGTRTATLVVTAVTADGQRVTRTRTLRLRA